MFGPMSLGRIVGVLCCRTQQEQERTMARGNVQVKLVNVQWGKWGACICVCVYRI